MWIFVHLKTRDKLKLGVQGVRWAKMGDVCEWLQQTIANQKYIIDSFYELLEVDLKIVIRSF